MRGIKGSCHEVAIEKRIQKRSYLHFKYAYHTLVKLWRPFNANFDRDQNKAWTSEPVQQTKAFTVSDDLRIWAFAI